MGHTRPLPKRPPSKGRCGKSLRRHKLRSSHFITRPSGSLVFFRPLLGPAAFIDLLSPYIKHRPFHAKLWPLFRHTRIGLVWPHHFKSGSVLQPGLPFFVDGHLGPINLKPGGLCWPFIGLLQHGRRCEQ